MAKRVWLPSLLLALSLRSLWPSGFSFVVAPQHSRSLRGRSCVTREAEEGSSVKLMLSAEERQGLLDLGYSPEEAAEMRMELALVVLERQTRRPWGEQPMPQEWRDEAIRQARLADLEAPQAASSSSSTGGPDFSLVVGGTVVALLVLVAILVVVAGPAPPEGPTPSGYLPPAQGGGYIGSLPEYSLKS